MFLVELCYLTKDGDKTVLTQLTTDEIDRLIKEHEAREKEKEAEAAAKPAETSK